MPQLEVMAMQDFIGIPVSIEERRILEQSARDCRVSLSEYLRLVATEAARVSIVEKRVHEQMARDYGMSVSDFVQWVTGGTEATKPARLELAMQDEAVAIQDFVRMQVSMEEKIILNQAARNNGMSVSDFVRLTATEAARVSIEEETRELQQKVLDGDLSVSDFVQITAVATAHRVVARVSGLPSIY